ncbi:MAG: diaminopimelate epimerase [Planctomycetota bacterium]|nr:MAG: diaminopimelate epimerase [Planctomycetota bacterium]
MSGRFELPFRKMHGCGNDYIFVEADRARLAVLLEHAPALARSMSARHYGVGSDGLVFLDFAGDGDADLRMHMFNADGSRGETCGNALRCAARLLWEREPSARSFRIASDAGVVLAELELEGGDLGEIVIDMGQPRFSPEELALQLEGVEAEPGAEDQPWALRLPAAGRSFTVYPLSMGNPHAVCFVDEALDELDLPLLGPALGRASCFPNGANIEFVQQDAEGMLLQRSWERGSGETLACGSGACAVAVVAACTGRSVRGRPQRVLLRGGELSITWSASGSVRMAGPAREVYRGLYSWDAKEGRS